MNIANFAPSVASKLLIPKIISDAPHFVFWITFPSTRTWGTSKYLLALPSTCGTYKYLLVLPSTWGTYKTFWRLYQRSVHPIHLVVQPAGVAEVMTWNIIVCFLILINHNDQHHDSNEKLLPPVPSLRQSGVEIAPQLTHSRPSPK